MGTPTRDQRNAALHDWVGDFIRDEIRAHFPTTATILDVGAGWGKYAFLMTRYTTIDACEAWQPNVENNGLHKIYSQVFCKDICDLNFIYYDVLIFGDVFEHIEREKAKELLLNVWDRCEQLYIAVPFLYPQGAAEGNPYEIHRQADLTPELMAREYPMLQLLKTQDNRGVYSK